MKVSQEMIDFKLKQVSEFEAKYGVSTRTLAIRKWCTDAQYRNREEAFRSNVINSISNSNKNYRDGRTI